MKGVILDSDSLGSNVDVTSITSTAVDWTIFSTTQPHETTERIRDADIVLTNKVVLSHREIQASEKLKYIGILATGSNNIDLSAAQKKTITVCNVSGYGVDSVVQHTFALILALTTRLQDYSQAVQDGTWSKSEQFCLLDYPVQQLSGRTLGIVGYGELGRGVATIAEAFGMHVKVARLPGRPQKAAEPQERTPLNQLLPQVDVLSLHCPLTPETENLIDAKALALMKPSTLLINCARGGIVDEAALANALREHKLGGAGVDVLTEEPPLHSNPLLEPGIPNLIVTPHTAWAAEESRQKLVNMAGENLQAYLEGNPQNIVRL